MIIYVFKGQDKVDKFLIICFKFAVDLTSIRIFIVQGFRTMSSFLLLYSQRFGQYVFQTFSHVCWTREPTRNFEPRPLFNSRSGVAYSDSVNHNRVWVQSILKNSDE